MENEVVALCTELDVIRAEQETLRLRQSELNQRSMALDNQLNKILHDKIDPLLKGHWSARITLYKDRSGT